MIIYRFFIKNFIKNSNHINIKKYVKIFVRIFFLCKFERYNI